MSKSIHTVLYSYTLSLFNDHAPTSIHTLSLHDALPISPPRPLEPRGSPVVAWPRRTGTDTAADPHPPTFQVAPESFGGTSPGTDRKSTRLNSSHGYISYAVFCLIKKKIEK